MYFFSSMSKKTSVSSREDVTRSIGLKVLILRQVIEALVSLGEVVCHRGLSLPLSRSQTLYMVSFTLVCRHLCKQLVDNSLLLRMLVCN